MAFSTGTRINTNISAMNAFNALSDVNRRLGVHQLRLASGKRLNTASDDPAGFTIARKLQARSRALTQALNNVGDAKNVLSVGEGGLLNISDILVQIKEKVSQANNGSLSSDELTALATQITDFAKEVDDIVNGTKYNGMKLLDANFTSKTFQVGADSTDTLSVGLTATIDSADLGISGITTANIGTSTTLASVDSAINKISTELQYVGSLMARLDIKESNLSVAISNIDAAASRIFDADVAKEQLEVTKLQILQQTATVQLAQANSAPQSVLQLFR
jgi:flagellin